MEHEHTSFKLSKNGSAKSTSKFANFFAVAGFIALIMIFISAISPKDKNVAERCLEVNQIVIDWIERGLTVNGEGYLRNAKAVKSNDFSNVYFVSADLQGPGLEGDNDIVTFAVNDIKDKTGGNLVLSVDAVAQEFSDWFHGGDTKFNATMSNDGARESRDCVTK